MIGPLTNLSKTMATKSWKTLPPFSFRHGHLGHVNTYENIRSESHVL